IMMQVLAMLPSSVATAVRSISTLHQVKTWMSTRINKERPILAHLNVHRDIHDELRYEYIKDKATIDYELIDSNTLDLQHTNVPNSLQGKGVGKIIAKV
ncbi:uncharacterized protein GBIM_04441, partial [Gryllus bimaculatus]